MALSGMKGLQAWCKQITNGYRDVSVTNMTSSWRDGLAFCAIIHHFRPDLIDFDSLLKENIEENNRLAFTVAESLDIPSLLDVEDMVAMAVPDKLSIMTYVSQYYNYFRDKPPGGVGGKTAVKRPHSTAVAAPVIKKAVAPSPNSGAGVSKTANGQPGPACCECGKPVYLMERISAEGKVFHRLCLKCCVCGVRLMSSNYRYKTDDRKFYCTRDYRASKDAGAITSYSQSGVQVKHSNGIKTSGVSTSAKTARDRFLSDTTRVNGSTSQDDLPSKSRANAAAFLSGVIPADNSDKSKATKRFSAPASLDGVQSNEGNASNEPVKPARPPSLSLPAVTVTTPPTGENSAGEVGKKKKLVLKVKKKRARAPSSEAGRPSEVVIIEEGEGRETTDDMDKSETPKYTPDRLGRSDVEKPVAVPSSSPKRSTAPARPPATQSIPNQRKDEKSSPAPVPEERLPKKLTPSPERPTRPRPPPLQQATEEDSGKKNQSINSNRQAPERPAPAQVKTTKRRAPDRPQYSPTVVAPRFVGPRGSKLREDKEKDDRKIALRDRQISRDDISAELRLNEARQMDLERRGVRMEKKLRAQTKGEPEEAYLIEWFALVNEKNKLLRRENELIYMAQELDFLRQQQDIECELRALLEKSEHTKTKKDKKREDELLQKLLEFVSKRDQIVGRLEEDRVRELEEDKVIETVMESQGLTKEARATSSSKFFL